MQSLFPYFKTTNMVRINIAAFFVLFIFFSAGAQQLYKFDNKGYKAVYLNEAAQLMKDHPGYLLLDVRSPGEYADTSEMTHLNIGRLKGAVNISIDSVPAHLEELKKYSDKTIFVYCSHSQRSRKISKLLSDNGFTSVYNINGGMSVVNETSSADFPMKNTLFVNDNVYKDIASTDALKLMQQKGVVIIDVRTKDEFESKDTHPGNNLGHVKNAVNIPVNGFADAFRALNIPKEKNIVLYDQYGANSVDAAAELAKMGYTHVYNLYEGVSAFMCDNHLTPAQISSVVISGGTFRVTGVREAINLLSNTNSLVILDARPAEEFANKSSKVFLNVGHIKNAVSVPSVDALSAAVDNISKDTKILMYGSSGNNLDETICKALADKGFTNVYFLYQGVGRFAWASFNIENCKDGINFLTDHDGLY